MWSEAALLSADFDSIAYLRHSLHLPNVDVEQSRLNRCSEVVQQELRLMISQNSESLLQQVDGAVAAEREVAAFRGVVGSLGGSLRRLKHTIGEPHEAIQNKVSELRNSMNAIETLRSLQKFLTAVAKLPELVPVDIARAARTLRDIEDLLATNQLQGIEVAERHFDSVTKFSASIRSKAHELLKSASVTHNQAEIAVALQCFFSLGTLHKVVANVITEHKRELAKIIMRELDVQSLSSAVEQSNEVNRTRDLVFSKLDIVVGETINRFDSLMLMLKLAQKKRDPTTHESFNDALKDTKVLLTELWSSTSQLLQEKLTKLYRRGNFFLMLVNEYPRFHATLTTFAQGVNELVGMISDSSDAQRWVDTVLQEVEQRFVSSSLERHREKVQQITLRLTTLIPTGGAEAIAMDVAVDPARPQLPASVTALDVKGLTKLILQEVTSFRQDPHILSMVLKQACGSLTTILQRFQEALNKIPKGKQPLEGTAAQIFQFCVTNAVSSVHQDLTHIVSMLPRDSTGANISAALNEMRQLMASFHDIAISVISPQFDVVKSNISMAIDEVVEEAASDAAIQRLTAKVGSSVSRFILLLDRSAPGLEDEERKLVDGLLKHTIVKVLLQRPLDPSSALFCSKCLLQVPQVIATIPHLPDPGIANLRNQVKAFRSFLSMHDSEALFKTHATSVNPLLLSLHLIQRIPVSCFPSLASIAGKTEGSVLAIVLESLASEERSSPSTQTVLSWIGKGFRSYESASLDVDESKLRRWQLEIFQSLRKQLEP